MAAAQLVSHKGIVESVYGEEVTVSIIASSACASCTGKAMCSMSEQKEKKILVCAHNMPFSVGEEVKVIMRLSQGMSAVALAYVFPLCLFMIILLTLFACKVSEVGVALVSVCSMVLYYSLLYVFRDKLKKKYVFEIEKI